MSKFYFSVLLVFGLVIFFQLFLIILFSLIASLLAFWAESFLVSSFNMEMEVMTSEKSILGNTSAIFSSTFCLVSAKSWIVRFLEARVTMISIILAVICSLVAVYFILVASLMHGVFFNPFSACFNFFFNLFINLLKLGTTSPEQIYNFCVEVKAQSAEFYEFKANSTASQVATETHIGNVEKTLAGESSGNTACHVLSWVMIGFLFLIIVVVKSGQ